MKTINIILVILVIYAAYPVFSQVHIIEQQGLTFSPQTLTVQVGDTVRWVWSAGSHTTTSGDIPAGALPWDNPLNQNNTEFEYVVEMAGVYNYHCTPHQTMGMSGTIEAFPATGHLQFENASPFEVLIEPGGKNLTIQSNSNQILHVTLYTLSGVEVLNTIVSDVSIQNPGVLQGGMYILRIKTGSKDYIKKIIIA